MAYAGTLKFDTKLSGDGFKKGVSELQGAAKGALVAIGGALSAAGIAVLTYGSQMELGMAKVSTMLSGSAEDCAGALQKIQGQLTKTSTATGQSSASLSEAAYQALSAGVAVEKTGGFIDKAAKLAVGGFTTTESAVDALSSIINAYGEDVIDADKASKILMQTQNKGKTTIDELAHSISQVTPTAAAMGVGFDQVGASLATMTAQGVPTAQATTQLNQLFADLGKNGTLASQSLEAATQGTEYAGKSFSTLMEEGVPLSDLLLIMADYAKDNGKEMLDMFGSIESGKAALSIINGHGKTFTDNLAAMATKADVVDTAYSKMMDTFSKKKDVLIESAKNVATAAYKYIEQPLKKAADVGIDWMNKLLRAVEKDGKKIIGALKGVATTAATVLSAILAFKTASAVGRVVEGLVKSYKAASVALAAYSAALVANEAAQSRGISIAKLLASTLTTKTVLLGVLKGQMDLATASTTLFNSAMSFLSAHPVILVATAVAALTAGIVALTIAQASHTSEVELALEAAKTQHEEVLKEAQAFRELSAAQAQTAAASMAEIDATERLAYKLQTITDETGFVEEANRGLASYILNELNSALGTEYEMRDGHIQQYQTLRGEINKTIEAKRAEAMLSAYEEVYVSALKNRMESQREAAGLEIEISDTKQKIHDIEVANEGKLLEMKTDSWRSEVFSREEWYKSLQTLKKTLGEQETTYAESQVKTRLYHEAVKNYDDALLASKQGNAEQASLLIQRAMDKNEDAKNCVVRTAQEELDVRAESYQTSLVALQNYLTECQNQKTTFDEIYFNDLKARMEADYNEAIKAGAQFVDGKILGMQSKQIDLSDTLQSLSNMYITTMEGELVSVQSLLSQEGDAYRNQAGQVGLCYRQISDQEATAKASKYQFVTDVGSLLDQESNSYLRTTGIIQQSAADQEQTLNNQHANQITGLNEYTEKHGEILETTNAEDIERMQTHAAETKTMSEQTGTGMVEGQVTGIQSSEENLASAVQAMCNDAIDILSVSTNEWYTQGVKAGQGYARGLESTLAEVRRVAAAIAAAGETSLAKRQKSNSPAKVFIKQGNYAGQGYAVGMRQEIPNVASTGADMAESAILPSSRTSFSGLAQDFSAKLRAAARAQQQQMAATVSARMSYTPAMAQAESIGPGIASAITSALSGSLSHATITAPISLQVGGREILKCTKEAEATIGYNVGGMQYAW